MRVGLFFLLAIASCSQSARRQTTSSTTAGTTGSGGDMMSLDDEDMSVGDGGPSVYDLAINGDAAGCAPGQTPHSCPSPVPATAGCGGAEICGNGLDDNCDGHADENFGCTPGSGQPCLLGPPGDG